MMSVLSWKGSSVLQTVKEELLQLSMHGKNTMLRFFWMLERMLI